MKKLSVILSVALVIFFIFLVVGPGAAEERATREECVAKTKKAAKLIEEVGLKTAIEKMNDMKGPFMWKDSYVYCFEDETGKILAHKNQNIIGFEAKDLRDVNGKPYFREMLHVANTKGEGFVTYMYERIPGGSPEPKISYILKVPGKNIILGAGFFE
jgi:cytochrome c